MKQTDVILQHLEKYGSITPLEALNRYGIMRLASRISDLKKDGVLIGSETVRSENRYGEPVRYSRYFRKAE